MPDLASAPSLPGPQSAARVGVIDIGSNSIRLVVYEGQGRAPFPVFNEKILCGLGRSGAGGGVTGGSPAGSAVGAGHTSSSVETGGGVSSETLNPEGVALALANLERFARLAETMGLARIDVLATAAVRDAADGAAFVAEVTRRCGLVVRVLPGEEEARLSALGVVSGTPTADGIMGDLGGGSLELVALEHGAVGEQTTLPLGVLRLLAYTVSSGGRSGLGKSIDRHLDRLPWLKSARGRDFYPVGGSWRALAKLHMEHSRHPLHIVHHYQVSAPTLRDFAGVVARQSRSSLERMVGGGSRRRTDTLPLAALVLERLLRRVEPARVVFSAHGLREGHLFDLLSPEEQRRDPLLAACIALAERQGRFCTAEALIDWTTNLFADEKPAVARLRHAVCLMSDLGWLEHPDYRAEHAYLRLLRLPVAGLDHDERAFLATALYIRYGGRMDDPAIAGTRVLLRSGLAARAHTLGLALRLAHTLTGGVVTLLGRTALTLDEERVSLRLPESLAPLAGDAVVRRLEALARVLGRKAAVRII